MLTGFVVADGLGPLRCAAAAVGVALIDLGFLVVRQVHGRCTRHQLLLDHDGVRLGLYGTVRTH